MKCSAQPLPWAKVKYGDQWRAMCAWPIRQESRGRRAYSSEHPPKSSPALRISTSPPDYHLPYQEHLLSASCMTEPSHAIGLVFCASGQPGVLLQDLASSPPLLLCCVSLFGMPAQLHAAISAHNDYKIASGAWHSNAEPACSESSDSSS